jgi:hypothetical protein
MCRSCLAPDDADMPYVIGVSLGVGTAIAGLWAMLIGRHQVPELEAGTPSIKFHVAAELMTAVLLIAAGIGLWIGAGWATTLAAGAIGAALYSCVASPGYYADRGQWALVAMFAVLAVLLSVALGVLILG